MPGRPAGDGAVRDVPASPPARRLSRPSWRDPRLLAGLAMVAASVLLGARLLGAADDTVTVWSAAADLPAGTEVAVEDLRPSRVRFATEELAQRYLPADSGLEGLVLLRDVSAGELLPRTSVGTGPAEEVAELPIALASDAVPAGLRAGELVDVWVTPAGESSQDRRAVRVLEQVRVVAAPQQASALGPSATRQVVVGVPGEDEDLLARALAQLSDGTAVLVRRS